MDKIGDLLCRILGVVGLVKELSILSYEHNCCDVSCGNQVAFTSMSQLAKPKVVGLLIQQGRHGQFQRITSFNVQLLWKAD